MLYSARSAMKAKPDDVFEKIHRLGVEDGKKFAGQAHLLPRA
jgi:hypothetical protein